MAREIERKFLVKGDDWRGGTRKSTPMRQFYLFATPERSLRVRVKADGTAKLTFKAGTQALMREEFEYEIPIEDAAEMERHAVGNVIAKTRHLVDHAGHTFEVDVFEGVLAGLVLAELECEDATSVTDLPPWLGREVTGIAAYYTASLALDGAVEPA